jgi:multiple antibiotic resistance protein
MLTLSAHASVTGALRNMMAHVGILLAVVLLAFIVYLCYGYAPKITERVSPQTSRGVLRIISFVLVCIGVQITWNGVEALLKHMLSS